MRLYLTLEFNQPISCDGPFPSVGGFEVKLKNWDKEKACDYLNIPFDFLNSEYLIDNNNHHIVYVACYEDDTYSFPDMVQLNKHLNDIVEVTELYIDTDDFDDSFNLVKCHEFIIEGHSIMNAKNTKYMDVKQINSDIMAFLLKPLCWEGINL